MDGLNGYLTRREASKVLKVHYNTLYKMAVDKDIETAIIGKQQLYNVTKYLKEKGISQTTSNKKLHSLISKIKSLDSDVNELILNAKVTDSTYFSG